MKILVLNTGSSSVKYQLIETDTGEWLAKGIAERIGDPKSFIKHNTSSGNEMLIEAFYEDHGVALKKVTELLLKGSAAAALDIRAIGHRVVHGGDQFIETTRINQEVKEQIKALESLAPLHNPYALKGIEIMEALFPNLPQMATFDTAFHQTMPDHAFRYAIPESYYQEHKVRVYGFHGTSHKYVSNQAIRHLRLGENSKLITLHLGNGASGAAIQNGKSIDTSMGLGPLSGFIMGTRCGDVDVSVLFYMSETCGLKVEEIKQILNKQSGVLGIAGLSDMREVGKAYHEGCSQAKLAYQMYAYRIKKYIGSYFAIMNGLDALIFTGGIGENDTLCRKLVCKDLEHLGIYMDYEKNQTHFEDSIVEVSLPESSVKVLVVPTNEELQIALESQALL